MVEIGHIIRQIRNKKGMTVRELAEKIAISKSHLSQIENDQVNLNLNVLEKISNALDTPLYLFFIQENIEGISLVRSDERSVETRADGVIIEHLVDQQMVEDRISILNIPPNHKEIPFPAHQGKEFLFILSGTLDMNFSCFREYTLGEGDCLAYIARVPYSMSSTDGCKVLLRSSASQADL